MVEEKVWTVSEINSSVRVLIEQSLVPTWIKAEVGTLNIHRSGHVYVTLKDKKSQIRGVYFRGSAQARAINLQVGMEVEVFGRLTVYEARGEYQVAISQMRPVGIGNLQQRFEALKHKLHMEGLFDPTRRKPIPMLPRKIGVVTSPGGAAIKDFLQIINRRFPNIQIKIYPAAVQGRGAELQVARGVEYLNQLPGVDVIVVTRGGGSMEDLWPFNEEVLARAIAASRIPIISAVGHEIDFTIADFVADMRVPTPSAAAELVVGSRDELSQRLITLTKHMKHSLEMTLVTYTRRFESVANSYAFKEPAHMLREKQQRMDDLCRSMEVSIIHSAEQVSNRIDRASKAMETAMIHRADQVSNRIDTAAKELGTAAKFQVERLKARVSGIDGRLKALNPLAVLDRGYSVITDVQTGAAVLDPDVPSGTKLSARVAHGHLDLIVE